MKKRTQLMRIALLLSLTFGMLLPVKPVSAANLLVCKPSGGYSCIYSTITAAVAAAHPGDTIHVGGGTYDEHDITINKNLTIIGAGSSVVTVDAQHNGRIFYIDSGVVSISGMVITNGHIVDGDGGGILSSFGVSLTLNDVIVTNNTIVTTYTDIPVGFLLGGGICVFSPSLTMTNSQVTNNTSIADGAGIFLLPPTTAHLTNVLIQNNTITGSTGSGGGIYLSSGSGVNASTLALDQVTLDGNMTSVNGEGGGIYLQQYATVTISNSTISNNQSIGGGGLLVDTYSNVNMSNDTITGNDAGTGQGGGIQAIANAIVKLTNVTVAGNSAKIGGGIVGVTAGEVDLSNTILAGNTASISDPDCYSTLTSKDYNLIGNTTSTHCTIIGFTSHNITGVPAKLAALADNGGHTKTMALLTGSPAINAAKNATCTAAPVSGLDQRGISRPQGHYCDIGAYEVKIFLINLPMVVR